MLDKETILYNEKVTVYTTIFNINEAQENCVKEILEQSHQNFDWVVVYDCTNDRDVFQLLSGGDSRIKYVHNAIPGRWNALVIALRNCDTDLIFNQDFDDIPSLDRLELQINALNTNKNLAAVAGWYLASYKDYGVIEEHFDDLDTEGVKKILPFWLPFAHSFCGFRKSALEDVGGYPLGYLLEDGIIWSRLIGSGYDVAIIQKLIGTHFIHKNTTFGKVKGQVKKELAFAANRLEMRRNLKLHWYYDIFIIGRVFYRYLPNSFQQFIRLMIGKYKLSND